MNMDGMCMKHMVLRTDYHSCYANQYVCMAFGGTWASTNENGIFYFHYANSSTPVTSDISASSRNDNIGLS